MNATDDARSAANLRFAAYLATVHEVAHGVLDIIEYGHHIYAGQWVRDAVSMREDARDALWDRLRRVREAHGHPVPVDPFAAGNPKPPLFSVPNESRR